jgi:hypothetical protein
MRFEYYKDSLSDVPKLSVDGTVGNAIHFSHWKGNLTDASVKADTSTEIALNVVLSPERERLTHGIELITNNHFDTDGVLSVWTMLEGERALEYKEKLIAAAEAGDFSEYPSQDAVCTSIVIQGSEYAAPAEGVSSPLACELNGNKPVSEERAYELILPFVRNVLTDVSKYEGLWSPEWSRIKIALESFEKGSSRVVEHDQTGLSVVTLDPAILSINGFRPTRHVAPYTAIAHNARGSLFLIAAPSDGGWIYRIDYPYYSWAETLARPAVVRHDFTQLLHQLNAEEREAAGPKVAGEWRVDNSELSSAFNFSGSQGIPVISLLEPSRVTDLIEEAITAIPLIGNQP